MDKSSLHMRVGVGLQLKALTGERVDQAIRLEFPAPNNKTESESILAGVDLV